MKCLYRPFCDVGGKFVKGVPVNSLLIPFKKVLTFLLALGVDFKNWFAPYRTLRPNFMPQNSFSKLGLGVGRNWIELSLWFAPCAQLLWNWPQWQVFFTFRNQLALLSFFWFRLLFIIFISGKRNWQLIQVSI